MSGLIKKFRNLFISLILTGFGMYGFWYVRSVVYGADAPYDTLTNLLSIPLAFFIFKAIEVATEVSTRRKVKGELILTSVISVLFGICFVFGAQLRAWGMTGSGYAAKALILFRGIALAGLIFPFVFFIIQSSYFSDELKAPREAVKLKLKYAVSAGGIFLMYVPVLLAYYPAVMAYDFHRQSGEALQGFAHFWPYQPIAHTWLYWLFFKIGEAFGSLQTGMALYSIFQMLCVSAVFGYLCVMVYRLTRRVWIYILTTLFLGLFPLFSVMSVEATKDVIFTALFVLFVLLFVERVFFKKEGSILLSAAWIATAGVMVLFRKNTIYALPFFMVIYIIFCDKKNRIKNAVICAVMLGFCFLTTWSLPKIIGTDMKAPEIEKYSVITQSMGRVGYYHADDMDEETRSQIDRFVPESNWKSYNPYIADAIKWNVGSGTYAQTWKDNTGEVIKTWIKVGVKYPNEYIDSFFLTNAGYIFPDDRSWAEMLGWGPEGRMGAVYTYNSSETNELPEGIAHESKLPALENLLEKVVSENAFYEWSFLGILFKPSFYVWALFLGLVIFAFRGQKKELMTVAFPEVYFLTMLLGPCVQWRYIYPIAVLFPLIVAFWIRPGKDEK